MEGEEEGRRHRQGVCVYVCALLTRVHMKKMTMMMMMMMMVMMMEGCRRSGLLESLSQVESTPHR